MRKKTCFLWIQIIAFAWGWASFGSVSWANMANPWRPGEPVGEPIGVMRQLSVQHEKLEINLTPLARNEPARIKASYTVLNQGQAVDVDLVFVTFGHNKGEVTLNGKLIATGLAPVQAMPAEWKFPATPAAPSWKAIRFPKKLHGMQFKVSLPPGTHTIVATYTTLPGQHHAADHLYRRHILGYVLAPAKRWSSFKQLEVEISLPKRWTLTSSLPLTQKQQTWTGSFQGVPADILVLEAQRSRHPLHSNILYGFLGLLMGLIFTYFFLWHHAHSTKTLARTGRQMIWPLVAHLLIATVVSVGLTLGGIWLEQLFVDSSQLSQSWGYSYAFLRVILLLISGGGTLLLGIWAYLVGMRSPKGS